MKKYPAPKLKLHFPGDKGYNPNFPYPWAGVGKMAGLNQRPSIQVDGFYVVDRRTKPYVAIFQNCEIPMVLGLRPALDEPPCPFRSPGAAADCIKKMHLPTELEEQCIKGHGPIKIVAMVPDPGIGYPKPDALIMDKQGFNDW
jgi:hypothetical protein